MGLREDMQNEPVSALPLRPPVTCGPDESVRSVIARMKSARLGCVFIVDEQQRPIGKFTERLLIRLLARGAGLLDQPIRDHMTGVEACVKPTDPIAKVVDNMQQTGMRFVCVMDEQGRIVNLAGQRSVMEYVAERFPHQIKAQLMEAKLHMDQREGA